MPGLHPAPGTPGTTSTAAHDAGSCFSAADGVSERAPEEEEEEEEEEQGVSLVAGESSSSSRSSRGGVGGVGASSRAAAVKFCVSLQVPQNIPMDLRIGQRLSKPSPDTAFLALKQTQQLQNHLFLASLHHQPVEPFTHPHLRVPMERPPQDSLPGKQEQELLLLLNKDKSKRSAVASTVVKQKLAEVIRKKKKAALERTHAPIMPYR
ncbi:hypothetical protein JRQ81_003792 [Phrynocephalus forsythii]|uniref:Histone deacetylase n=1 Tax=Phrynocephalus forsythii TaxID=171643 RepID=A0A9Q0XLI9_9SAUR|nr:hypothetical protein JRQ81_003792 [Phrynocephalus forsythii]